MKIRGSTHPTLLEVLPARWRFGALLGAPQRRLGLGCGCCRRGVRRAAERAAVTVAMKGSVWAGWVTRFSGLNMIHPI